VLEIGPGPGLVTDRLRQRISHLTAIEIDKKLAGSLKARLVNTNVAVVQGEATSRDFPDATFDGALSMTMLHHAPSPELQDRLLAETFRVLKPGGLFIGMDSTPDLRFRLSRLFDTMVPVDPGMFAARSHAAGFEDVAVREGKGAFRWRARKPL
jgi:SAM-dependent methyltransferase